MLSRATLARADVDGFSTVHFAFEATMDDFFQRSVFENCMAVEHRILLMRDKLDELGGVVLGTGDHVSLSSASAVDAVGMIAPLVI